MSEVMFFGKVDRNKKGTVSSEYPAWAMGTHIEELEESIHQKKTVLERKLYIPGEEMNIKATLDREEKRLSEIKESRPALETADENRVYKGYKEVGKKIADSLFSRDDMERGLANPHEEKNRMVKPCIEIDPELAVACNIPAERIKDNKVSRNDAARIYKIIGSYFGENTNIEALRPDRRK